MLQTPGAKDQETGKCGEDEGASSCGIAVWRLAKLNTIVDRVLGGVANLEPVARPAMSLAG